VAQVPLVGEALMADLIKLPVDWFDRITKFPELDLAVKLAHVTQIDRYFVAGGYLRDRLNNRPFKDIDIFVPGHEPLDEGDTMGIRYDLRGAMELTAGDGTVLNIVRLDQRHTLKSILERMDIGLCQIGVDTDGDIYCTEAYLRDVKNNTLTVMFTPSTEADHDHIARVSAKYPDMRVVQKWDVVHTVDA
jgi:hypothetical protein